MAKAPVINVSSALFSRNGISGRRFHAAIVDNPFGIQGHDQGGPYLVISLDKPSNPKIASPDETFVIRVQEILEGNLVSKWRGDDVAPATLQAMRDLEDLQLDEKTASLLDSIA